MTRITRSTETDIQRLIQLAATEAGHRLWRFPVGRYQLVDGRWLTVGAPGMSDLIGLSAGGQFMSIEVKAPGARTARLRLEAQERFISQVRGMGGVAGFAASVEDAVAIWGKNA